MQITACRRQAVSSLPDLPPVDRSVSALLISDRVRFEPFSHRVPARWIKDRSGSNRGGDDRVAAPARSGNWICPLNDRHEICGCQFTNAPCQSIPPACHHLTTNVTGILTGCTLALELVAVTVIVKVPAGVPCGGGGGGG